VSQLRSSVPRYRQVGSALTAQLRYEADAQAPDEPPLGWTVVLRRQPVHLVEGRPQGGYTDLYELVCCDCGDDPELDYRDVSAALQLIRGPYTVSAGISAYGRHVARQHRPLPVLAANPTRRRTGYVDGKTG
jgi:hypothetical protein